MRRILFLLPGGAGVPVGGVKVVLEYANRLAADGYKVGVVYPSCCRGLLRVGFWAWCKAVLRFIVYSIVPRYTARRWFPLDKRVKEHWVWSLRERNVPKADVYVATAAQTAYYHLPLRKWVIARWLQSIVESEGESCTLIPNGFDFSQFRVTVPLEQRECHKVCMLYHTLKWKGCDDGFKALAVVKELCPELRVTLFGVYSRPKDLPDWYEYYQHPSRDLHTRLYNEAAIFLGTSHSEGWGLTVGEAMACGCAVVCTDNPGYLEMSEDGNTALVVPVGDVQAMAERVIRLIEDDELRLRIAHAGHENILRFTWDRSYAIMRGEIEK